MIWICPVVGIMNVNHAIVIDGYYMYLIEGPGIAPLLRVKAQPFS